MIGDTSPILGLAKDLSNLLEREFRIYAPHKDFLVRLINIVQNFLYSLDLVTPGILVCHAWGEVGDFLKLCFVNLFCPIAFLYVRVVAILSYLAKPNSHVAISAKTINRLHCFEEGITCNFLGKMLVAREPQNIQVNVVEICIV